MAFRFRKPAGGALSTHHSGSAQGLGCLAIPFFGLFLAAGLFFLYLLAIKPLMKFTAARNWSETPCTIVTSDVEMQQDDDGPTYRIAITYDYIFAGRQYHGDQYDVMGNDFWSSGRAGKQEVVDQYPPGRETVCYVNPADPEQSVIHRGLTATMFWGFFPLPFVAVGLGGLLWRFGVIGGKTDEPSGPSLSVGHRRWGNGHSIADESGPVTLKPQNTPGKTLLAALCVAAFWNGIVSVFVYQAYLSFRRGQPEWCLTIFMVPFVGVGIGLIVWVVHSFIALFNPRPVLTLSRTQIPLGESADGSWRFSGSTHSIQQLKIVLQGREHATYRRGTDTHTDEHTFYEAVLLESHDPLDIAEGEIVLSVPTDTMHSFKADRNKIEWSLRMTGEIPLRPDIDAVFPIRVVPHVANRD